MLSWSRSSRSSQRALVGAGQLGGALARRAPRTSRGGGRSDRSRSPRASSCSAANSRIVSSSRKRGSPSASPRPGRGSGRRAPSGRRGRPRRARTPARRPPRPRRGRSRRRRPTAGRAAAGRPRRAGRSSRRSRRAASAGARAGRASPAARTSSWCSSRARIASGDEQLDPGRGELDRERHAVEPGADRGDGRGVLVGDREAGRTATARAMNSRTASYWPSVAASTVARPAGRFSRSRPDSWLGSGGVGRPGTGYSCSPETRSGGAARDDDLELGRAAEQVGDDRRRRRGPARSCRGRAGPACRAASRRATSATVARRLSARPIAPAIRGATSIGSRTGSSGDEEDAVGEVVRRRSPRAGATAASCRSRPGRSGSGAGSPRAAPAASASSRVAADEGRQLGRQVVRAGVERAERRELRPAGRRRRPGRAAPARGGP